MPPPSKYVGTEAGNREFQLRLFAFLDSGCYKQWQKDSEIRGTGPYIDNGIAGVKAASYGTHPAVRVYYSPEIFEWMKRGDRKAPIPDRAMIIKEMYPPPASEANASGKPPTAWTIMIRDGAGSWDGWYWSFYAPGQQPDEGVTYPNSMFGNYCINCHASAADDVSTFITMRNLGDDPLNYLTIVPTMTPQPGNIDPHLVVGTAPVAVPTTPPLKEPDMAFLNLFRQSPVPADQVKSFPVESYDHVVAGPRSQGPGQFITSDQCIGCHDATANIGPALANMQLNFMDPARQPVNLSPYGEWRASMMGLAGRDPIFHAQLESETDFYHPKNKAMIENLCAHCHGVMGQRQLEIDHKRMFQHDMFYASPAHDPANQKYGGLARDGISCTVCHSVSAKNLGTMESFTGNFEVGPPGELYGPFENVVTDPMVGAIGKEPKHAPQIKSSALCGSCHTVYLPVLDKEGKPVKMIFEQTTYLEWLNSEYQDEREPVNRATLITCQGCHLPPSFEDRKLAFRIANIEDETYPLTDNRLPDSKLRLEVRQDYGRHQLAGINLFGLSMFEQFPAVLGIRGSDPMNYSTQNGLVTAIQQGKRLAERETARVEITDIRSTPEALETTVRITNLAGHSFPSGVGFRRAFLEFVAYDKAGNPLWASGRTTAQGAIVEGLTEKVLATEFFTAPDGRQVFQPHYEVITREDQVQIYEELVADLDGKITTSFLSLDRHLKDNRLLPKGWSRNGPYAEETVPKGEAAKDPEYQNGSGSDVIRYRLPMNERPRNVAAVSVTLYYQATPPYYLNQRFTAANGPETKRLLYIASKLNTKGTPIENWKLKVASASRQF